MLVCRRLFIPYREAREMKAGESGLDNKDHSFVEIWFLENVPRTERASQYEK